MPEIRIEQALFLRSRDGDCHCQGRSPDFRDDWLPEAERLCRGFGDRPESVACASAVFAQPLGKQQVVVAQVADRPEAGPQGLGFRLLLLTRNAYRDLAGDPFLIADRFPPPWGQNGGLPSLTWSEEEPPPRRMVEQVREVLKSPDGTALLGGVQALVDGGHVALVRPEPQDFLRKLWLLVPTASRCDLWPASFAFGNALGFDALVVPKVVGEGFDHYLNQEQAEHYPEGRYELNLQLAAEQGDQQELDQLFARRSRAETWRLGVTLLIVVVVLTLASALLNPSRNVRPAVRQEAPVPAAQPEKQAP